jgi:hypothetical protein
LYRVDNFKGFTNFLGLLYSKGLVNSFVINDCITRLVNLIYNTTWGQTESENVYEGYRRILNNTLKAIEKKTEYKDTDLKFVNQLMKIHHEITEKNKSSSKLRRFTMMYHGESEKRLQKLITVVENSIKA